MLLIQKTPRILMLLMSSFLLFSEERQVPFVNLPGVIRLVSYALGAARSSLRTGCDRSKENPFIPR